MQDMQLMQASGDTVSTIDDWSSVTGTTQQPTAQIAKAQPVKGQRDHLGRACRATRVELFIPTAMRRLTNTCMIGSSLIHDHRSTYFAIDPSCTTCTKSILHYP